MEILLVLIACRREISLDQCVLRQVICITFVAAAEGEQKTTEGILLTLNKGYEDFTCHGLYLQRTYPFFFGLNLLGKHFLAQTIVYKEGDTDSQQDYADETARACTICSNININVTNYHANTK